MLGLELDCGVVEFDGGVVGGGWLSDNTKFVSYLNSQINLHTTVTHLPLLPPPPQSYPILPP